MSYRYDEETESWVADGDIDHKHDVDVDDDIDHLAVPSAPSPPPSASASSSQHSMASSMKSSHHSSSSSYSSRKKLPQQQQQQQQGRLPPQSRREWSNDDNDDDDDDDFEYVTGDQHRNEAGSGFPTSNTARSSTSRWFSPSAYISVPSGRGPQHDNTSTSFRGDPSRDASLARCFREVFSCCGAIWHAVKQPFHQNLGLVFCFVASGGLLFGMGLIFASPGGVSEVPVINCELGELGEGLYLTPSCANLTQVLVETTCTWSCATGYDAAGGTAKRTCQEDGAWSGKPLACEKEPEVMACSVPISPAGASLEPSDVCKKVNQRVPALTKCLWVCDGDLHSVGGNPQRECREDGTWSGEPVECQVGGNDDEDEDGSNKGEDGSNQSEDGGGEGEGEGDVTSSRAQVTSSSKARPEETTRRVDVTEAPQTDTHSDQSSAGGDGQAAPDMDRGSNGDHDKASDTNNGATGDHGKAPDTDPDQSGTGDHDQVSAHSGAGGRESGASGPGNGHDQGGDGGRGDEPVATSVGNNNQRGNDSSVGSSPAGSSS